MTADFLPDFRVDVTDRLPTAADDCACRLATADRRAPLTADRQCDAVARLQRGRVSAEPSDRVSHIEPDSTSNTRSSSTSPMSQAECASSMSSWPGPHPAYPASTLARGGAGSVDSTSAQDGGVTWTAQSLLISRHLASSGRSPHQDPAALRFDRTCHYTTASPLPPTMGGSSFTIDVAGISVGRLSTRPKAPSRAKSQSRTTVRAKFDPGAGASREAASGERCPCSAELPTRPRVGRGISAATTPRSATILPPPRGDCPRPAREG